MNFRSIKMQSLAASLALLTVGIYAGGCGSSEESAGVAAGTAAVTISGKLAVASSLYLTDGLSSKKEFDGRGLTASALSDYSIYCVTFNVPPTAGTGTVATDGAFSLTLEKSNDTPFGCFILQSSVPIATLVFVDATKKDMSGNSASDSKLSLKTNADFGNVTLDLKAKTATVAVANFASAVTGDAAASGTLFDFTGTWKFAPVDYTLPTGYSPLCAAGSTNCQGPQTGEVLYVKRVQGKKFTPDATCQSIVDQMNAGTYTGGDLTACNGTTGSEDVFGIMVWQSEALWANCSGGGANRKLGVSFVDAKAHAQVDMSTSGLQEGSFTWAAGWTDGWKSSSATASHDYQACLSTPLNVTVDGVTYNQGWVCPDAAGKINVGMGGGCVLTADPSREVSVNDWSGLTGSCTGSTTATVYYGNTPKTVTIQTCTQSGTTTAKENGESLGSVAVTCKNVNGQEAGFNWGSMAAPLIASSAACSGGSEATDAGKLAKLQCYAEYFWNNQPSDGSCVRELRTNYMAQKPEDFIMHNGPEKPKGQYVFEMFKYANPNSGSFTVREEFSESARVGNSWINCRLQETFTMAITKVSDVRMQAEFNSVRVLLDTDKPACVGAAAEMGVGELKNLSYMDKQ